MGLKIDKKFNRISLILMILLFCSFTVLETYSWGAYIMIACAALIFAFTVIRDKFNYKFVFDRYLITITLFAIYSLISSVWAFNAQDAITKGITLFEIMFMIFVVYNYLYSKENGVRDILTVIKWSSFIIVVYSILYYGIDVLIAMAAAETRIENSYTNVNTIGMLAAIGTIIEIDEIFCNKKFRWTGLFCIPSIFMIAITQSRKAFVVLLFGIIVVFIWRNSASKDFRKTIVKILFSVIVMMMLLYLVLSLPMFSGMLGRMEGLFANITGMGSVDSSTRIRTEMVRIGLEQFKKTPLFGMGIGNPHYLSMMHLGKDAYLHNNFIELLAGGGIVGFAIYYSMYIYLFINFWRYRRNKNKEYIVCVTIMLLLFVMDYGMVSYYNKSRYIYLMVYFLEVAKLKKDARRQFSGRYVQDEHKQYCKESKQLRY